MKVPSRLKTGDLVKFFRNGIEDSGNVIFATTGRVQICAADQTFVVRERHEVRRISGKYEAAYPERFAS